MEKKPVKKMPKGYPSISKKEKKKIQEMLFYQYALEKSKKAKKK